MKKYENLYGMKETTFFLITKIKATIRELITHHQLV